ncbi:hypothetical protein CAOG_04672 [Capsaspora owczarzaki ATCC 30864]|uniref:Rap-GAP domain-containing protein n=1 Tax=Capsaspora owczarzaki (strain ATCC 30864) TaxID=595528 RepID=A0A0D2WRN9_CAPO3|nr:hypothetical protein CAOG_04672 [Capsaspora owczarzaki ATCC 30864]KJE93963.1 hypothetical protein CAOG_004672 [Capsaspora owczarzaki ATCC 30864]|eukprot:XP_004347419.1 hypothetical protein CAOG_04672 [Capsaspora owczarzaki ATCC 30864]
MATLAKAVAPFWAEAAGSRSHTEGLPALDDTQCDSERFLEWQKTHFGDGKGGAPSAQGSNGTVLVGPKTLDQVAVVSQIQLSTGGYEGLLRTAKGYTLNRVEASAVSNPWYRRWFGLGPAPLAVTNALFPQTANLSLLPPVGQGLAEALVKLDETQVHRTFKFGVLYRAEGQTTEEEMFNNDNGSPAYDEFLGLLGDRITLNGWKRFRGDLDVKTDTTGRESVFTEWRGYQIMFHVATLLPKMKNDRQQVERKRHLGNDIVIIVFQDTKQPYSSDTVVSHQNHVVVVVSPENDQFYHVEVLAKNGVTPFRPELPSTFLIPRSAASKDYLLNKLVNGERASYGAEGFESRVQRVRESLIKNLVTSFLA